MQLYDYFRSSAAYRVRITLNLKGIPYQSVPVNLLQGEEQQSSYLQLNPQGLVPTLVDQQTPISQSLAICEYLEETHPSPPILPSKATARARVRALAQAIACDIHPLNNLRVLDYLVREFDVSEEQKLAWYRHWIAVGFSALEQLLANSDDTGDCCHGDSPSLADICLVPQVFNARRFELDMVPYPTIERIDAYCSQYPAFILARPDKQADASR